MTSPWNRNLMRDLCERCGTLHDAYFDCSDIADTAGADDDMAWDTIIPMPAPYGWDND